MFYGQCKQAAVLRQAHQGQRGLCGSLPAAPAACGAPHSHNPSPSPSRPSNRPSSPSVCLHQSQQQSQSVCFHKARCGILGPPVGRRRRCNADAFLTSTCCADAVLRTFTGVAEALTRVIGLAALEPPALDSDGQVLRAEGASKCILGYLVACAMVLATIKTHPQTPSLMISHCKGIHCSLA